MPATDDLLSRFRTKTRGGHKILELSRNAGSGRFPILGRIQDTGGDAYSRLVSWTAEGRVREDGQDSPFDLTPVPPGRDDPPETAPTGGPIPVPETLDLKSRFLPHTRCGFPVKSVRRREPHYLGPYPLLATLKLTPVAVFDLGAEQSYTERGEWRAVGGPHDLDLMPAPDPAPTEDLKSRFAPKTRGGRAVLAVARRSAKHAAGRFPLLASLRADNGKHFFVGCAEDGRVSTGHAPDDLVPAGQADAQAAETEEDWRSSWQPRTRGGHEIVRVRRLVSGKPRRLAATLKRPVPYGSPLNAHLVEYAYTEQGRLFPDDETELDLLPVDKPGPPAAPPIIEFVRGEKVDVPPPEGCSAAPAPPPAPEPAEVYVLIRREGWDLTVLAVGPDRKAVESVENARLDADRTGHVHFETWLYRVGREPSLASSTCPWPRHGLDKAPPPPGLNLWESLASAQESAARLVAELRARPAP